MTQVIQFTVVYIASSVHNGLHYLSVSIRKNTLEVGHADRKIYYKNT